MAKQKTNPTDVDVGAFLDNVADDQQRADSFVLLKMMQDITGLKPRMWGPTMVGFGEYHYKYASGHEGDCFQVGFAPRKGQISLYFMPGVGRFAAGLKTLGKHKTGKACLYIKRLADIDLTVLRGMLEKSYTEMKEPAQQKKRPEAAMNKRPKK